MKAVITFKDDKGYILNEHVAKAMLKKEIERLESACPKHTEFYTGCDICHRMGHWTANRKVEFLIDLLLR